jgi:hypothetical protein
MMFSDAIHERSEGLPECPGDYLIGELRKVRTVFDCHDCCLLWVGKERSNRHSICLSAIK